MSTKPFVLTTQDRTRLRKRVLDALGRGRRNAVTGSDMALILGERDDRKIRVLIRELIAEGVPIASTVTDKKGYFIVETEHEAFDYIRVLKERIKEDSSRLEDFIKAVRTYRIPEQLALRLGAPDA